MLNLLRAQILQAQLMIPVKGKKFCRLVGSRRNILRYGSLGIAVSCLIYTTRNWKAMQFVSPKGLLNYFTGGNSSIFASNEGKNFYIGSVCSFLMNNLNNQSILANHPGQ